MLENEYVKNVDVSHILACGDSSRDSGVDSPYQQV